MKQNVARGSDARLDCNATTVFAWTFNNFKHFPLNVKFYNQKKTLYIYAAKDANQGIYECEGSSEFQGGHFHAVSQVIVTGMLLMQQKKLSTSEGIFFVIQ